MAGDRRLEGVEGSSIARGIARDRLLGLPDDWLPVEAGQEIRFEPDGPPAAETFLTVYPAAAVADGSMAALAGTELEAARPVWRPDLPAGRYVVTLSRTWSDGDSVVHAFGIEVGGRSG